METINKEELKQVEGGILKIAVGRWIIGLGAATTFLIGLFNGYSNGSGVCSR